MVIIQYNPFEKQPEDGMTFFGLLSSFWEKRKRMITIVVEGLGDVFWGQYWLPLSRLAAQPSRAQIWLVDIFPLKPQYVDTISEYPSIHFLNKSNPEDEKLYQEITSDVVLISVPDAMHLKTTEEWLGENWWKNRAAVIFIEKPYDQDMDYAAKFQKKFLEKYNELPCVVIPFDHYLAKISNFISNGQRCLQELGDELTRIEFSILESKIIDPPERAKSLKYGMIYDLLCHPLSIISTVCDLDGAFVDTVESAKYENAPEEVSDTFDYIELYLKNFNGKPISVTGSVGKGVGERDEKYINIFGRGERMIHFSFWPKEGNIKLITESMDCEVFPVLNAYEYFIDRLFEGDYIRHPVGALSHLTALNILKILSSAKTKANLPPKIYKAGTSVKEIRSLFLMKEE